MTTKAKTDNRDKFVTTAAGAFMLIDVSIGKRTMQQRLPKTVEEQVLRILAAKGELEPGVMSLPINLFGPHHTDFLSQVVAPRNKLRTYVYEATLPFSVSEGQKRGPRLIPVARVPEFLQTVAKLVKAAEDALAGFMRSYDLYCEAGCKAADHNVRVSGVRASKYLKYPDAKAFRESFYISISPPRPLPAFDLERFGSLPADLAAQIADANNSVLAEQLEVAKVAAMEQAQAQMDTVVKQLRDGKRLHSSLITNSRAAARMLRDMVAGYDNDPRLLALADLIDQKIGSVADVEVWKNHDGMRDASIKAATTVSAGIRDYRKAVEAERKAAAAKVKAKPAASNKSAATGAFVGGVMADLL